ncbi:uncharacterized protein F5891DRAFT_1196852 [Suillus fuscotomentosus]|uniref:Uncharacterized protein n=1 Tax=Suillus fuscotomentosus TaxID=1912939 RepID=A0AAD4DSJ3_9AGAM|nr:uncharacterized protein F5891DRAFT_1196852 [Suillus fuscotomentosus]KAG1893120.1 hypothetical protein F5891DRAFT_1196852 [Suillus fuscotomentosus]
MRSTQTSPMHGHLTTSPSSFGNSSYDRDSSDGCAQLPVQTPPSSPPPDLSSPRHRNKKRRSRTTAHSILRSGHRKRSPASSDTSPDPEEELFAFPHPPSNIMQRLLGFAVRAQIRFKPYEQPHGLVPNALELRFFQRCLKSGDNDMSVADIEGGKDILKDCLKCLSQTLISQAVSAKEADCEAKCMAVLGTAWAVEAKDRYQSLLEMIVEEELERYTIDAKEAAFLRKYLVGHSKEDLEVAKDFDVGAYSHNYRSFAVANSTLSHIGGVKSCLPEGDASSVAMEDLASNSDFEADD